VSSVGQTVPTVRTSPSGIPVFYPRKFYSDLPRVMFFVLLYRNVVHSIFESKDLYTLGSFCYFVMRHEFNDQLSFEYGFSVLSKCMDFLMVRFLNFILVGNSFGSTYVYIMILEFLVVPCFYT
jgi:hypothetical protein